ncbi:hypothetical protein [Paraburkholderia sacchari]|uniref:hypothetical protein n=1 Tax=Paraburkholderia sacchari TaxID=159450 RepID=UPI001BCD288E|nr:hypothetical protein [Paraburkholderia sacchari]
MQRMTNRFGLVVGTLSAMLASLFFIPFFPGMPTAGIDFSWIMAVNETLVRGLVFGRDMIFTSGPLSPIYTGSYSPQTDWISLWGSVVIAAAVFGGFMLIGRRSTRWLLIALPFATAAAILRDSIHYTLGLIVLLFVFRLTRNEDDELHLPWTLFHRAALLALTAVLWCMPLIKGSFGAIVYGVSGLSIIMLARASRRTMAWLIPIIGISALVVAWSITGQPLSGLLHFFIAQKPVIASYTDAMSLTGSAAARHWWLLSAAMMVIVTTLFLARDRGIDGLLCTLGMTGCLFIAFKAGFVRQDGHIWAATNFVLFAAIALGALTGSFIGIPLIIAAAIGATAIDNSVLPRDPSFYMTRFHEMVDRTCLGIDARLKGNLPSLYKAAVAKIRTDYPLPETSGSADLYSTNLSVLFANGMKWSPRPGLQSYSVYDPAIDRADAAHLLGASAPDTVFFELAPIDNRLPSLEDARSWPLLMTQYSVVGQSSGFLVMTRDKVARTYEYGDAVVHPTVTFGQPVEIPDAPIVQASIFVKPSLIGKIERTLYKLPEISIQMTLSDGRVVTHRFIPSMATRFMLSPYVNDTSSWALTAAGLNTARVKSITLNTDNLSMYEPYIDMHFSGMKMVAQKGLRSTLLSQPVAQIAVPFDATRHADCAIDTINSKPYSGAPVVIVGGVLRIGGWTAPDGKNGIGPDDAWIVLTAVDGHSVFFRTKPAGREDVASFFSHPQMKAPGINLTGDVSSLSGDYMVRVFASDGHGAIECPQTARVSLH